MTLHRTEDSSSGPAPDQPDSRALAQTVASLLCEQDAQALTDGVLRAARAHLGMDVTFLAHLTDGEKILRGLEDPACTLPVGEGDAFPADETYCARQVSGRIPNLLTDARRDPLVRDLAITEHLDIGAYVGVGIHLTDGTLYGTLCGLSHAPRPDLHERDVRFLQVLAAIIGAELSRDPRRTRERRDQALEVAQVLTGEGFDMVFQPIVRLADRRQVGVEALSRFDGCPPVRPPDTWFAAAWDVGLGPALELMAVRHALARLDELPDDMYLALNADPRTVASQEFSDAIAGAGSRRVLVELTEHAPVADYQPLLDAMSTLRRTGTRFAVDDAGAGYSGLNHMVRLAPDVIKLDRFLTRGVDRDPARQALTASAAAFAAATGTRLIAEGIETEAELDAVHSVGVRYGQGFLFGRPGRLAEL